MTTLVPEADRLAGVPHPRETAALLGQDAALDDIRAALAADRLHHGWLVTGPRGIGKATLAWIMARAILARPPRRTGPGLFGDDAPAADDPLSIGPDHPVARRMAALSEPRLALVRRPFDDKTGRLRAEIPVDEIRKLKRFFALSAADGGSRVVIVDSADELNTAAANALLKLLEEPPKDTVLILVSHQPHRLLPTIRSRCRTLRLAPLAETPMAAALEATGIAPCPPQQLPRLARLAGGSVGRAVGLLTLEGIELYDALLKLVAGMPDHDRRLSTALAETLSAREAEDRRRLAFELVAVLLADLARLGATGSAPADLGADEAAALARLCPSPAAARRWAEAATRIGQRFGHGTAVNLDPQSLLLDMVLTLDATARDVVYQTGAA